MAITLCTLAYGKKDGKKRIGIKNIDQEWVGSVEEAHKIDFLSLLIESLSEFDVDSLNSQIAGKFTLQPVKNQVAFKKLHKEFPNVQASR